ncbi:hypothetical protein D9M70_176460 [compost metagenome]
MATTMSRLPPGTGGSLLGAGWVGVTGAWGVLGAVATWGALASLAAASWSNRSTTRRLPYCWLGARAKLLGVTAAETSITTRRSVGVRWAERTLVIGVLLRDSCSSLVANWAPLISMTMRLGAVSVKTECWTGPDRSKTRRVLSGARQRRTPRTSAAARTSAANAASRTPIPANSARERIPHPIFVFMLPRPGRHTMLRRARCVATTAANGRPLAA